MQKVPPEKPNRNFEPWLKDNGRLVQGWRTPLKTPQQHRPTRSAKLVVILGAALIIGLGLAIWLMSGGGNSPIPRNISDKVTFPVYYPEPSKLPAGYKLDLRSFTTGGNAVLFNLNGPKNTTVIFSEQVKPPPATVAAFVDQRLPLNSTVATAVGTATVGSLNNRSFTSLPINNSNTWIFVQAPLDIGQSQLDTILRSITD